MVIRGESLPREQRQKNMKMTPSIVLGIPTATATDGMVYVGHTLRDGTPPHTTTARSHHAFKNKTRRMSLAVWEGNVTEIYSNLFQQDTNF